MCHHSFLPHQLALDFCVSFYLFKISILSRLEILPSCEQHCSIFSLQVGMQNSSLGVVLATSHFPSPMVALPPAMSAVIMNIMGSSLGFFWRYIDPSDSKNNPKADGRKQGQNLFNVEHNKIRVFSFCYWFIVFVLLQSE